MTSENTVPDMTPVLELAGWCAAEALVNLSELSVEKLANGEPALVPALAIGNPTGKRHFTIFDAVTPDTFRQIEHLLEQLTPSDKWAVVTSDSYATIDDVKHDAVDVQGYLLAEPRQTFRLLIVYELAVADRSFCFRRPRLQEVNGFDDEAIDVAAAFARGRESHPKGPALWERYYRPA